MFDMSKTFWLSRKIKNAAELRRCTVTYRTSSKNVCGQKEEWTPPKKDIALAAGSSW